MAGRLGRRGGRFLRANALSKGLLGGSRAWRFLFFALFAKRVFGKYVGREPQHLTAEKLKPGQSMTVRAIAPESRRARKRARRQTATTV
jgi:hypothetical protein